MDVSPIVNEPSHAKVASSPHDQPEPFEVFDKLMARVGRLASLVAALELGHDEFASAVRLDSDDARRFFGVVDSLIEIIADDVSQVDALTDELDAALIGLRKEGCAVQAHLQGERA